MGCPSSCNECGKKFKLFGIKKKCKRCMDVVCKSCLATHLELKHSHQNGNLKRRKSWESFNVTGNDEQKELQFLSPVGSPDVEFEYADPEMLYSADSIETVSDEDDDGVLFDDDAEDDAEDDELVMKTLSRQSSIEEKESQYNELCKIQSAVATWALKEKHAKQEMRRKKYGCTMTRGFSEVYDYDKCDVFAATYAVMATLAVWTLFGVLVAVYLRARSLSAGYSYML